LAGDDNKLISSSKNNFEKIKFRPLKDNEIKLLFGLWQLTYVDNNTQVTAEMICEKTGLNENQFSIALRDLRQISPDCYVKSIRGAVRKLAVYSLIDESLVSTGATAQMLMALHSNSFELRVKFEMVKDEVVKFFGSDEKVMERLNSLVKDGYLRIEEKGVYVFCERFMSEIKWIKKIAEYSAI
jgi:hypothetical protein